MTDGLYLDNAATTPVCPEAVAAFSQACEDFGNPSSGHAPGRAAAELLRRSRRRIEAELDIPPDSLFFTSGGTESINTALRSAAATHGRKARHILTSTLEHAAVRETLAQLRAEGYSVTAVPPRADGHLCPDDFAAALREDSFLCSVTLVASESGALADIAALSRALRAKAPELLLHVDAVQGFGKLPLSPRAAGVDYLSLSGHKIHAPKGIGALYVREGLRLAPLLRGGGQEGGRRSGTESVPLAASLAAAVDALTPISDSFMGLGIRLLREAVPDVYILPGHSAPHILTIAVPDCPGEVLLRMLSDKGVFVGTGSACSGRKKSEALRSIPGVRTELLDFVLRLSVSRLTTMDQWREGLRLVGETVADFRTRYAGPPDPQPL